MNYRLIIRLLGLLVFSLGSIMGLVMLWSLVPWLSADGGDDARHAFLSLLSTATASIIIGGGAYVATMPGRKVLLGHDVEKRPLPLARREALLLVALAWIVGAVMAATPYFLWTQFQGMEAGGHPFTSPLNCYFEAMSGLTTTGATILTKIGSVPDALLLWRALTHWIGGIGIVVLFVALLPSLGSGSKRLFRIETPGPDPGGVRPHVQDTARILVTIYLGITIAAVLAYRCTGAMDWFDSFCHAFSVVSTGGLSTRDASIGAFDSLGVDLVSMFFMLLLGINFALFYQVTRGRWKQVLKNTELRVYLGLKVLLIAIIAVNLFGHVLGTTTGSEVTATAGEALRHSAFVNIAMQTGTGFTHSNYDLWPYFSKAIIVCFLFVGGCAGSTTGGVKVIRFWIVLKIMAGEVLRSFRPTLVKPLRIGGRAVTREQKLSAVTYIMITVLFFGLGTFGIQWCESMSGDGLEIQTALSASISTLSNVGPGLGEIGPRGNYSFFSDGSKAIMTILMVMGRLELFSILVLFTPAFWRGD